MRSSAELKSELGLDIYDTSIKQKVVSNMPDGCSNSQCGMVLRLERSSIHDGDGFRTVIFLKGCPLRCLWCSTPESQSPLVEVTEDKSYGITMSVEQLMQEIRKDSIFYFHSGGGITISGGEPLSQAELTASILRSAKQEGISTAIETSLYAPYHQVEKVLPYLDIIYADIKHIDPIRHQEICGVDNACILLNLRKVDEHAKHKKFVIRMPLIPGINDDEENLHGIGRFCCELKNLHCMQLLPYHRLGMDTYRKLGRSYPLTEIVPPTPEHMEKCRSIIRSYIGGAC